MFRELSPQYTEHFQPGTVQEFINNPDIVQSYLKHQTSNYRSIKMVAAMQLGFGPLPGGSGNIAAVNALKSYLPDLGELESIYEGYKYSPPSKNRFYTTDATKWAQNVVHRMVGDVYLF